MDHSEIAVVRPRCADSPFPLGVPGPEPRLSWSLAGAGRGLVQQAYRLQVAEDPTFSSPLADSGRVEGGRCLGVDWPGDPLASRQRRWWRVKVWAGGSESAWSEPAFVEAPLLGPDDWTAVPVGPVPGGADEKVPGPCPLVRGAFELPAEPVEARLYITALGCYQAEINGLPVGDEALAPGWTAYRRRLLYRTHDVGRLLRAGTNVIGITLADGWYRGHLTWTKARNVYGDRLAVLAQLHVRLADGREVTVGSDPTWRTSTGVIRSSDIYDGEEQDLSFDQAGWSQAGFDDSGWSPVEEVPLPAGTEVLPAAVAPVRAVEELPLATSWVSPSGARLIDFGQNVAGRVRLVARGEPGATLTIRHGEVLDGTGELYTAALRGARATDRYRLDGTEQVLEPRFTFHGFRYAEVSVDRGALEVGPATAVVLSSDLERIGGFACSNDLVNRLVANVVRSQRGNFVSVPTDCPQRDERLGWTGDAQVFAPTACFNFDASAFFANWLQDVAADQTATGAVPPFVPDIVPPTKIYCAAWGDAATVVPWAVYEAYGDPAVLARQLPSMKAWVDYEARRAGDDLLWTGDFQFGDWLDPDAPAGEPQNAKTPGQFVATAYLAHSAGLVADAAEVVGDDDGERYRLLSERAREALWKAWSEDAFATQTAAALALQFDLAPPSQRPRLAERLAELVAEAGDRIATGFVGTPLVCPALSDNGQAEAAYRLLLQREFPSWLYPVLAGATSIWERWDAIQPDGTIHSGQLGSNEAGMLSFNHYAYGAVAEWLYRRVAGLAPDRSEPGYRHVVVSPRPGGGLGWARASIRSPYGDTAVAWSVADNRLELSLVLPPNTWATVTLPTPDPASVRVDGESPAKVDGVRSALVPDAPVVQVGSGRYRFDCAL
ncbi:MAG TPA: family 78 glycoside hydrolase catalytic domain [Acidimicrobiales bacterium]|nr:family 78 glycoside hydrolase catalytic domain [Acidimicrobiales bacterium]